MSSRQSVKIDGSMFERLIEEIKICDVPDQLDIVLTNEFNDTLYFEGGQTITVSHWDTQTERRVHVDFAVTQLIKDQRDVLQKSLVNLCMRGVENIIEEANDDVE